MSHSKRNTSRAVFTSHEREQAKRAWSASTARLSRDSFLPFASCRLCLEPARDPVACPEGDVFCRECALSDILAQRREIRRLERKRELDDRDGAEQRARQEAEARDRAIRHFELTQSALDGSDRTRGPTPPPADPAPAPVVAPADAGAGAGAGADAAAGAGADAGTGTGTAPDGGPAEARDCDRDRKRKFELDEDEIQRIATQDQARARRAIEEEKAASRPRLPSFWTPSVTPASNTKDVLLAVPYKTKTAPTCPASVDGGGGGGGGGGGTHAYSLHTLVPVHFSEEEEDTGRPRRVCPACRKALSNASKAMLAKPCGHVLCRHCVDKFMRPALGQHDHHHHHDGDANADKPDEGGLRCYVCDTDLVDRRKGKANEKDKRKERESIKPGLVEIRSEGTGFSAGGVSQVTKTTVAFQC